MLSTSPKCVFVSGDSRMGKSTFCDRLIREIPERAFHYLSYDAVKDMLLDNRVFDNLKISHLHKDPALFLKAAFERDMKVEPFMHSWANSEMSRGHDVIVNMCFHPKTTDFYETSVTVAMFDLRSEQERVSHLRQVRDTSDSPFNWMTMFDDDAIVEYARASNARSMLYTSLLDEIGVPWLNLADFDGDLQAMHDEAMVLVKRAFGE